jgi:diacylglycerol kinase family enzyme
VDDGQLHACVIRDASPLRRFALFNKAERGRHIGSPEVELLSDRSFSVRFQAGGPPPRFEVDGDVYASSGPAVDVELLPQALEVVVA